MARRGDHPSGARTAPVRIQPYPDPAAFMIQARHHAEKHDDLIYDVGLEAGKDSDFYLKKGFRVVAFEADAALAQAGRLRFADAIRENRFTLGEGAIVDPEVVASGQRTITFYVNKAGWGTTSSEFALRNERLGEPSRAVEVEVVDFGACIRRYGMPYYMKIDIEGADQACLRTLLDFHEKPDYLSIESEKVDVRALEDEVSLLEELGYDRFKAVQQARPRTRKPPSPAREGRYVAHTFPVGSSGLFGRELPGEWKDRDALLREYRGIFRAYRRFGDHSALRGTRWGPGFLRFLQRVLRRPMPGWYDTHARHSTVTG
jgi:FkbM family methyltransferase